MRKRLLLLALFLGALALVILAAYQPVVAQDGAPLHPVFALLDSDGRNVLESGQPISTMQTCGACHDTAFIARHSFHADVGLSDFVLPGETPAGREWDSSPGLFGKWNPLLYRYLSPQGDTTIDLTTADWVALFGARHVGGGPAHTSRDGRPLTALPPNSGNVEASRHDPVSGELVAWDWNESGVVEMNCFLCHTAKPDNTARVAALQAGEFGWANTATLSGSVVEVVDGRYQYKAAAFDATGQVLPAALALQDPTDDNCGLCHGLAHVETRTPLMVNGCSPDQWSTMTTGQIFSPQRLADSGLNLVDKQGLSRSWDVHAERVIGCTDCHYALNNPIYYQEDDASRPAHLLFDPRRIDLGEYLVRPLHQFAKVQSAQGTLAPELDDTQRRCESCHSVAATHDWLPYKDKHMAAVSCESCHIPKLYAPSREYVDWTVLHADGTPHSACRGIEGEGETFGSVLVSSYEPLLLPRADTAGASQLAPFNLVTAWYWLYGEPPRPVPLHDLQAAWLDGDTYHPNLVAAFDRDGDGRLAESELLIDSPAKEAAVAARLRAQGLDNPRIAGETGAYSINHTVTHGEWVTRDCRTCHGETSRLTQPYILSDRTPGGVMPTFVTNSGVTFPGQILSDPAGRLVYQLDTGSAGLYVLGHDAVGVVDRIGIFLFLAVMLGVVGHGGLRYAAARRHAHAQPAPVREVYMYDVYERLWHWLQTAAILLLLFTGLIIHKPDLFGVFSFRYVVQAHNVLAAILVINAALSLFYHLVSGEIRQYLPRPRGFFDQMVEQALFYLRGIFRGETHPFTKSRQRKLNPLQQLTYFGILNVLLPLQVITGVLMWGAQRWPDVATRLGGLPFLAPFHTLLAWLFASFIVMHVYLTTTGHTPLAGIKAMMLGWDEVETQEAAVPEPGD